MFIWHSTINRFPIPQHCHSRPEVKTKPIYLHIIVLYYLFLLAISHNSEKLKCAKYRPVFSYYKLNVRYVEESHGVTDFRPLSGPYPCPLHLGEVNDPPPFPLLTQLLCTDTFSASRGANLPIPHSYMIYNRKPLSGADLFVFFKCLCRPPRVMKKCRPGRLPGSPMPKTATDYICRGLNCNCMISVHDNIIEHFRS